MHCFHHSIITPNGQPVKIPHGIVLVFLCFVMWGYRPAVASERRFVYTYESSVLNAGDLEFEPWTTLRNGRTDFYNRYDQRLEFEIGLTDRLQTAWYVNLTGLGQDKSTGREFQTDFKGFSSEWKYKVMDPVADLIGLAFYLEGSSGPKEAEVEGKIITDKRFGHVLAAFNLVGGYEWEFEGSGETETEAEIELDLGLTYFLTARLTVGLEVRNHNEFPSGEGWESSALFAGPTLSYATASWWTAVTIMPQIRALKGASEGRNLDLDGHEKVEARVIIGFHL